MRYVNFDNLDAGKPYGPQIAEALAQADGGISDVRGAAIVEEHASRQRDVVGEIYPTVPRELVAFCGPANFGLVVETAANLERNGMHVVAKWWRDSRGIIRGIAICEADEGER